MFPLGDTGGQLAVLFLLACVRSNCADEILIQTFRNVGSNGSVPNVILQQLNLTDKLQCCLRCIERPGCIMLGILPQRKCLLLGDPIEGIRNQSVIAEDEYVIYSYSSVTTSAPTMHAASSVTTATSPPPATTISASTHTTSSTTLPSPSYTTNPETTVTSSSTTTTTSSTSTSGPVTTVPPSTAADENTTPYHDPHDPFIQSKYTVITQTGTLPDSETNCLVHLRIFGEHGLNKMLSLDNPGEEMERGANDTFTFQGHRNLGKVTRMQLRVVQYGMQGGWFVIGVEVKRERVYQHYRHFDTYYSYLNKWFQSLEISLGTVVSLLSPTNDIDFKLTSDYFEKL